MRATFVFDKGSMKYFDAKCEAAISRVGNGSRKALLVACNEILDNSLAQVPIDTTALMSSAFFEITGDYRTGWDANVGYGKYDIVNPKTGKPVSTYMLAVHEDLHAVHPVGKAKFLEDPVREYATVNFPRTVFKYAKESLAGL